MVGLNSVALPVTQFAAEMPYAEHNCWRIGSVMNGLPIGMLRPTPKVPEGARFRVTLLRVENTSA